MPHALAIAHGLDWDTEISSFWSWFEDARAVCIEGASPSSLVQQLVDGQREKIEKAAAQVVDRAAARYALTVAVALVGFHYSSNQKLLAGLEEYGIFEPPRELPTFDTVR